MVAPLCEITMLLVEKTTNSRLEFEDADEKISGFLTWQETDQGIAANLPKIQEEHKEIMFVEWEAQLIKTERAISRERFLMDNVVELINDNLHIANLISDHIPGQLLKVKELEKKWEQGLKSGSQQIDAIQELTWDTFWSYLVKPHNQQLTLKCLSHAIANMLLEFSDATYTGQLHSRLSHLPEVKDMLSICQLHTSDT